MNVRNFALFTSIFLLAMLGMSVARAGVPYPDAATPKPMDRGELKAISGATPISVTVALSLSKLDEAENLLKSVSTPGDPQFHHFLTADQFVARFAPADADVANVVASLARYGLAAERTSATTLKVTGLPAAMERAFAVSLHSYEVSGHDNVPGYTFHAPLGRVTVPAEISALVTGVVGLDSRPILRPLHIGPALPTNPNSLTVVDFANHYDVRPLYEEGISGRGRTIGILTFASFTPSDAFAYWSAVGLSVSPNRIQIVNVDGGPGAPSDASGSMETALDVEQSGGIAPRANILVYQGGNNYEVFVDVFAAAVDANLADALSISWGYWEYNYNLENYPVTDPITGKTVGAAQAVHELLVRAGIQGQSVFSAAGDGGAYEINNDLGCDGPYSPTVPSSCRLTLSVAYPGSDPAITAGGGTTLPSTQVLPIPNSSENVVIDIPRERVWGWDWMQPYCDAVGTPDLMNCQQPIYGGNIFPAGSGGGVSVLFGRPSYQNFLPGVQRSQPDQIYQAGTDYAGYFNALYIPLPAYYAGRNVPDVSFDADPFTGYLIYYTSSVTGFSVQPNWGGTSFVAPQLSGVSALLGEYLHGRIGLLNYELYGLAQSGQAYSGPRAPLHAIEFGDNWFYYGSDGYNPAAGLGTLDVANFAHLLQGQL